MRWRAFDDRSLETLLGLLLDNAGNPVQNAWMEIGLHVQDRYTCMRCHCHAEIDRYACMLTLSCMRCDCHAEIDGYACLHCHAEYVHILLVLVV